MKLANSFHSTDARGILLARRGPLAWLLTFGILCGLVGLATQPVSAQTSDEISPPDEAPITTNAGWKIQTVDDPATFIDMTDRSLRFDASGNPHMAFGDDHLYYARWDQSKSKWFVATVDSSLNVGRYASLALDSFGNPRIAYYDVTNGALKFAYSSDGGFHWAAPFSVATFGPARTPPTEPGSTIEEALRQQFKSESDPLADFEPLESGVGGYTSIATDAQNKIHISYYDWNQGALMYINWNGSVWSAPVMVDGNPSDPGYDVGKFSSIAIDSSGMPHISYMDEKYDGLKYAYNDGNGWVVDEIDSRLYPYHKMGGFTSLVLDGDNNPYISYQDWLNFTLYIASPAIGGTCTAPGCRVCGPNGNWQCRIVDDIEATGFYSSIGLSGSGVLMIGYYQATDGDLMFASSSNGRSWDVDNLVGSGDAGSYTSLAIDGLNFPGISYYDLGSGYMSFIRWNGSSWVIFNVVRAGELGTLSSLAVGPSNAPYISYFDDIGDQLKLANGLNSGLFKYIINVNAGGYSSIKLTKLGEPRIAYYYAPGGDLIYAYRISGIWYFQTVDSANNVGLYPSLALDGNDRPYISYYDATNADLKFAYWNGSAWVVQVADPAGASVGAYSSLVLNQGAGQCIQMIPGTSVCPQISYYDATNGDLKHAFWSLSNAWATQVVDGAGSTGQYTSIARDSSGGLHISYHDVANLDLRHATGTKGSSSWTWSSETVDSAGNTGKSTSIALDAANNIHISYYDASVGDLRYALWSGFWSTQTVDSVNHTGVSTSLALFSDGSPGISYYDLTLGALKFATTYPGLFGRPNYLPLIARNR